MKKHLLATTLVAVTTFAGFSTIANAASAVPCEDVLITLNDALAKAKLTDAETKAVADLKAKGEERCTAEDDRRADGFFNNALAIVIKK
jgi:prolyl-tRNA synthetase